MPSRSLTKKPLVLKFTDLDLFSACASGSVEFVYTIFEDKYGEYDHVPASILKRCLEIAKKHDRQALCKMIGFAIIRQNMDKVLG